MLLAKTEKEIFASARLTEEISQRPTSFTFDDALPISARRDEIKKAIVDNQIVILAGATGSGKTTQLPKICLEAGLGTRGLIAHTQPRRIAARTVASRIAQEMGCEIGQRVGFQIRFKDVSSDTTQLKLMTDGVLLAEFQRDPWLSRYEVIIIDEAHERSLNIDFIFGLLKPLLKKRADLKLIITSATIDLDSFAEYFSRGDTKPPVIEVSGRTFPVEVLYQDGDQGRSSNTENIEDVIADTVGLIVREEAAGSFKTSGDILVFCAGEREIRAAAKAVRGLNISLDVLPLYARLGVAEQNKVFQPSQHRKVVLATNVAETSITVPGIAYVIDPGVARVSQYNFRAKVQKLPIAEISQASANQRMGRCGRVRNGVCFRLYSQENFDKREAFTPAEILRSNLTSVVLQMIRLGVKDPKKFDFLDQPDNRLLNDGIKQLQELGAIDLTKKLTPIGRLMSDLPVDPQLARMLVEARDSEFLLDAIIVAAAQSMRDVREIKPTQPHASEKNNSKEKGPANRIAPLHPQSDFGSQLMLWQSIEDNRQTLSNKGFKELCERQRWSIQRVFEWRDLVRQLKSMCAGMAKKPIKWTKLETDSNNKKFKTQLDLESNRYESLHRSIVAGFLSNILNRSVDGNYVGTRNRAIVIGNDSSLKKTKAKWLVATELTETNRLYARNVAVIRPDWVMIYAKDYLKYSYSEPRFKKTRGNVTALRKSLYKGLTLKQGESCSYQTVNLEEARIIFIQEALVEAMYEPKRREISFMRHNQEMLALLEKYEVKMRRRTLALSDLWMSDFYAEHVPTDCANVQAFEKWAIAGGNDRLKLRTEQFVESTEQQSIEASFPNSLSIQGKDLRLSYLFDPSSDDDGVTLHVPVELLAPLPTHIGDWLVPGLLADKCAALIKTLPKPIRQSYTPANDAVARIIDKLSAQDAPLIKVLGELLYKTRGTKIPLDAWNEKKLEHHLRMNYSIEDVDGSLIEVGRDLLPLKQRYADAVSNRLHASQAKERKDFERSDVTQWHPSLTLDPVSYRHHGMTVVTYPMHRIQKDGSIDLELNESRKVALFHNQFALPYLIQKELEVSQRSTITLLLKEIGQRLRQDSNKQPKKNINNQPRGKTSKQTSDNASSGASQTNSLAAQLKNLNLSTNQGQSHKASAQEFKTGFKKTTRSRTQLSEERWIGPIVYIALRSGIAEAIKDHGQPHSHSEFIALVRQLDPNWHKTALTTADQLRTVLTQQQELLHELMNTDAPTVSADEAIEDMKGQIYRLCDPNHLLLTPPADLQQYPRLFKAISQRSARIQDRADPDELSTQTLAKWQTALDALIERVCRPLQQQGLVDKSEHLSYVTITIPGAADFAWMLEEWRVSLFAQQLKTRYSVSEQRVERSYKELEGKVRAHLELI